MWASRLSLHDLISCDGRILDNLACLHTFITEWHAKFSV